jgi:hypothetical protein
MVSQPLSQPTASAYERRPNMHAGSSTPSLGLSSDGTRCWVAMLSCLRPTIPSPCRLTAASSGSSSPGLFGSRLFALSMYDPVLGHSVVMSSAGCGPCPIRQGASDSGTSPAWPTTENQRGFTDCVRMRPHSNGPSLLGPQGIRKLGAHVMAAQGRGALKNAPEAKV